MPHQVRARRRKLTALAILATLIAIGAFAFQQVSAARREAAARIATIAMQLDAARASHSADERRLRPQIDWLEQRVTTDDSRNGELEARLSSEQRVEEALGRRQTFVALELEGRIVEGREDVPAGTRCTVAIPRSRSTSRGGR